MFTLFSDFASLNIPSHQTCSKYWFRLNISQKDSHRRSEMNNQDFLVCFLLPTSWTSVSLDKTYLQQYRPAASYSGDLTRRCCRRLHSPGTAWSAAWGWHHRRWGGWGSPRPTDSPRRRWCRRRARWARSCGRWDCWPRCSSCPVASTRESKPEKRRKFKIKKLNWTFRLKITLSKKILLKQGKLCSNDSWESNRL